MFPPENSGLLRVMFGSFSRKDPLEDDELGLSNLGPYYPLKFSRPESFFSLY